MNSKVREILSKTHLRPKRESERGSTTETQSWLIKCKDLQYISGETFALKDGVCREIIKMLNSLIGSLRRK